MVILEDGQHSGCLVRTKDIKMIVVPPGGIVGSDRT